MPTWKKVIVSGSSAHLTSVTASTAVLVGTNQQITTSPTTTFLSGSFSGSFQGSIAGSITSATSASVLAITDSSTSPTTQYLTFVAATSGHPSQSVDLGLSYVPSTDTLSVGNIAATGSTFNLAVGTATSINIGNSSATVTIPGNLNVQGATTTISSSNLLVADKFILLASGSTSATDGGIIVQSAVGGTGFAYFLDNSPSAPRWGFTSSLSSTDNTTNFAAFEYAVSVRTGSGDPTGDPTYGGASLGHGNMFVNSTDQSIWIWS